MNKNRISETEPLLRVILDAIEEKQGRDLISIDLSHLGHAVADYFIICHGDSVPQVGAIAGYVEEMVARNLDLKVLRRQGFENSQWVLLVFDNVVVHIFLKEYRDYYKLEDLWADGVVVNYADSGNQPLPPKQKKSLD
ncbi:MAG: ribosome silencing factor [Bacteroidales bacterium]